MNGNRSTFLLVLLHLSSLLGGARVTAQEVEKADSTTQGIRLGEPITQRWRIGYTVKGQGGVVRGIQAYATVPMDWPEQKVTVVEKEVTRQVKSVRFRTVDGGVRQMIISIPRLRANETAKAIYTFEIEKRPILGPRETDGLRIPAKPSFELRKKYLGPSPFIESRDPKITAAAKSVFAEKTSSAETGWSSAETIFDWVREKIEYKFDKQLRGASAALEAKVGDCEEMSSLFVALCRVNGIPARAIWIPGHCYPEFYLEDAQGKGHWFPCQAAGAREFGSMSESRPILQKGDNFQIPGQRKRHQYLHEHFSARHAAANPQVEFVRKRIEQPPK